VKSAAYRSNETTEAAGTECSRYLINKTLAGLPAILPAQSYALSVVVSGGPAVLTTKNA
jgi:hypothetical protein